MMTNILEVAGFDDLIETHFYGVTYIPASVLVKIREAYTFNIKIHLKEIS